MGINRTFVARKWHNAVLSVIGRHGALLSFHLRATLLNEVILGFLLALIALLAMSLAAIARMPRSSVEAAEQPADEPADVMPQFMSAASPTGLPMASPWQPTEAVPGQRSYAEAAYRLWPGRPGAPPPPGAPARFGEAGEALTSDHGSAPWQQPVRPPSARGGPPWGPAPKPESEPPSWAQPPGRP